MKISVVIPTYKPQDYLLACLKSLKNQTFDKSKFEIILVLNGEKNPYFDKINKTILEEFTEYNVNFIQTEIASVSNARNIGLENAKGDYIIFLDDDDLLSNNYLFDLFEEKTTNGIVVSNVQTFTTDISCAKDDYITKAYASNLNKNKSIFFKRSFLSSSCCKLIPRELIGNRRFNTNLKIGEDSLFMFLISDKIENIKLCSNPSAIYFRRIRPLSASRKEQKKGEKIKRSIYLIQQYSSVFLHSPLKYNFSLYLSRVIATIIK